MSIICPECGGESLDVEFCDLCNADLSPPGAVQVPETCPLLPDGERLSDRQRQRLARPEAAVVVTAEDGQVWRIHWLGRDDFPRWFPLIEERAQRGAGVLPPCRHIDDPQGLWLAVACRGRPAQPWWTERARDPLEELRRLREFVEPLARTLTQLHEQNLVWLNFDPEEIEEIPAQTEGSFLLCPTNLDLQVFPAGHFPQRLVMTPSFAAPEVFLASPEQIGPATDVFHLAMFSYYWLARLLPDGFAGEGLPAFAFHMPALRIFVHDLPPGLEAFLTRSLAQDPEQRPASPTKFLAELDETIRQIEHRWASVGSAELTWEIGAHTRTGRSKSALHGRNEDAVLVKHVDPRRALIAVADGISICAVGNGAIASEMTLTVLERTFDEASRQSDFARLIARSCQEASRSMIDWGIEHGFERALREEQNLMGTTLCAGWLEENCLNLANLGDSRAYLVTATAIEQLTVDGDMSTSLLADGTPPEEVRQLGAMGKALSDCVGGCRLGANGELIPWTEGMPALGRFPLLPGDVIVLCSDGLVEEGAFLNPETLFRLIREHGDLSAAALSEVLAGEADALQHLPSLLEPDGFGDNISCIVVKVLPL
jgi:serine/threonine protein phosphatase PrpC